MTVSKPTIGVIGAGKVGSTFARLLYDAGYTVVGVYSRTHQHAVTLASRVGTAASDRPEAVIAMADLTLLTVTDDAIAPLAEALRMDDLTGKALVHASGAHDWLALESAARRGAMTGSLHPAFPFADVDAAVEGLPGASFAVEASHERLKTWLLDIVTAFDGQALVIPAGGKVTYHLALAIVSNYAVTLYAVAEDLLLSLGSDPRAVDNALNALLAGTVENLRVQGIPKAMVGPLTRADVGTIAAHLDVLRQVDHTLFDVYAGLARLSYPMLKARDIPVEKIEELLRQGNYNETHNP